MNPKSEENGILQIEVRKHVSFSAYRDAMNSPVAKQPISMLRLTERQGKLFILSLVWLGDVGLRPNC
jgi:hypothetical protein